MQKHKEELKKHENEKEGVKSQLTEKWQETVKKALAAKTAEERALEDARRMRLKAIDREELEEKVTKMTKENWCDTPVPYTLPPRSTSDRNSGDA